MSVSLSAPPPVSGLHLVQVVHAARRLDEESGVGPAVAVAVAAHSAVVGEGAGRLAVEGVTVARLPHRSAGAGSWNSRQITKVTVYSFFFVTSLEAVTLIIYKLKLKLTYISII